MRKIIATTVLFVITAITLISLTSYKSEATELEFREVAGNLEVIWEMRWGPDNYIWLTERPGRVQRVNPETGEKTKILDITDDVLSDNESERGLMGMAFSPSFSEDSHVFLSYNYREQGETKVKIVRYTYHNGALLEPITILDNIIGASNHDGCRLEFDDAGKLYITTGDAAETAFPQSNLSLNGKVLRLNPDGSIPEDNPYYGNKTLRNEIWSLGHRNPQGLIFHKGIMYSSEHGPNNNDELNIIEKNRNYGWPRVRGYCDEQSEMDFCAENNVREPIAIFGTNYTLAVAGIRYYDIPTSAANRIAEWQNSIMMVTLKTGLLMQLKLSPDGKEVISQSTIIDDEYGRLRSICLAPDGRVFIGTSNKDGRGDAQDNDDKIIEIKPKDTPNGVETNDGGLLYEVYPNPSSSSGINIKSNSTNNSNVAIFDILGNRLMQVELAPLSVQNIDMSNLAAGQYTVQFLSNGNLLNKIVKIIH